MLLFNYRCTFCSAVVEEDEAAGPQKDSRLLLAQFKLGLVINHSLIK